MRYNRGEMPAGGNNLIKEPALTWSRWTAWPERNEIKNAHLPGVYLLAQWEKAPPPGVNPLAGEIAYIGGVSDNSLSSRWQQFNRAAVEGKPGHTGGLIYRDMYAGEVESLYVAAFAPEGLPREMRTLFIRYLENRLVWEWAKRWESAPPCNGR